MCILEFYNDLFLQATFRSDGMDTFGNTGNLRIP